MKNLVRFGCALVVCAIFSSCGIPMAAVRTLKNAPQTVTNATNELLAE